MVTELQEGDSLRSRIEALLGNRDDAIHLLQQALAQGLPFTTVLIDA